MASNLRDVSTIPARLLSVGSHVRWLSAEEQRIWRRWLLLNGRLAATLQRELHEDSGLSSSDFEVLVNLTDSPDGRVRVTELATQLLWERSRVSHHVTRMERRGMVQRADCAEDGQGAWVVITPAGRATIERATPAHVEAVRHLMFDALTDEEVTHFGATVDKLLSRIEDGGAPAPSPVTEPPV